MNDESALITAFISYSREDEQHNQWVQSLADFLLEKGINVMLDQYDLLPGGRLPHFMEQTIAKSDYVVVVCTPVYKEKSDSRKGGVGYETHIISAELLSGENENKFIPVIRKGNVQGALPNCLKGKLAIDLTGGKNYETGLEDLITTLYGVSKKPPVNKSFDINKFTGASKSSISKKNNEQEDPIHILGIITDRVTVPKRDGSIGSALYKIPFKLSGSPSSLWKKEFITAWNDPPRFTTMHRPGIASVVGDEIILDGTTIEEVRDYHRETLNLCVNIANKNEKKANQENKQKKEAEEKRKLEHYKNVQDIAESIKFDDD